MLGVIGTMILKAVAVKVMKKTVKVAVKAMESKDVTLQDAVKEEFIKTLANMPNEITDVATHVEIQRRLDEEVE